VGKSICRKAFAWTYGVSVYHLKKISDFLREQTTGLDIPSPQLYYKKDHREFRDSDLPEFNYCQTEAVFKENLQTNFVEPHMIRAALMSKSDAHQYCVIWFEEYFRKYGDYAPNRDEVKLAITRKKEIYDLYVEDMKERPTVQQNKFYEIWNALFPRCVSRPWCDIPGKCNTCYEIDRMRRESRDGEVQEQLREAHLMHRGGLFMLERNE
jgi:hypothetical protein